MAGRGVLAREGSQGAEQHPQSDRESRRAGEPGMRSQPLAEVPPGSPNARCASHRTPPAGATGEDVIHMHNELIRGESVEPILLGALLGELRTINLIHRLWLDQLAPFLLGVARCLRLPFGLRRRERCWRDLEDLRCAPGEAGLAPASGARRLARLAITRTTVKTRRCWRRLGRWRWRSVSRGAAGAGRGDVKRDHAVARECATGLGLLGHDEPKQRGVAAKGPLKAGAKPSAAHGLGGVPGALADVLAHDLTACGAASTAASGAFDCCGLVTHRGY